jgi:two-component system, NarL family, invasion response regulator UvrY
MNHNSLIKISMADDHTITRKGVMGIINSFGDFEVIIESTNGKELIDKMEQAEIKPEICILDISMPVLNGYETAAIIKKNWPEIKILALSAIDEEFSVVKMLRSGANGYVVKDCDPLELKRALLGIHNNSYYHSELVTGKLIHDIHHNNKMDSITTKEMEFLSLCCTDLTYRQIAEKMNLSPRTIDDYRDALFKKLNIRSRTALAIFSLRTGLCSPD